MSNPPQAPVIQPDSSIWSNPAGITLLTSEEYPFTLDVTPQLLSGQTPASPSVVCWDLTESETITLTNPPSISGNVITLVLKGTDFTAQHKYLLLTSYVPVAGQALTVATSLSVPA